MNLNGIIQKRPQGHVILNPKEALEELPASAKFVPDTSSPPCVGWAAMATKYYTINNSSTLPFLLPLDGVQVGLYTFRST